MIYTFSLHSGWKLLDELVPASTSMDGIAKHYGYKVAPMLQTDPDDGMSIVVREQTPLEERPVEALDTEDEYLVEIHFALGTSRHVFVRDLPSLLALLKETVPTIDALARLADRQDREAEEADRKGR